MRAATSLMKAMLLRKWGGPEVFESADIAKPVAKGGEVLVKIAASSVNTVDTMIRSMGPELPLSPEPPAVLGMDFAGTVEAVGEGVTKFGVGDEVYGCAGGLLHLPGTLAEFISADARLVAKKPKTLSMKEAAALPLCGITAYEGLKRAGVAPGQKVLIHGGTGGVGHIALQLAKHWGADAFATGGGEKQLAKITELGATPINYKTEEIKDYVAKHTENGRGFDVIFDTVGGANMLKSFEAAALNANIATTLALLEIDLTTAHFKGLSLHVVMMLIPMIHDVGKQAHGDILEDIAAICDAGNLVPLLDDGGGKTFKLEDVADAHARLESRKAMGKVVIVN